MGRNIAAIKSLTRSFGIARKNLLVGHDGRVTEPWPAALCLLALACTTLARLALHKVGVASLARGAVGLIDAVAAAGTTA